MTPGAAAVIARSRYFSRVRGGAGTDSGQLVAAAPYKYAKDMALAGASRVEVGRHSIAYRRAGQGPTLVLLHGFLCDSRCWRTHVEGLSDEFSVVTWDAPGAGASSDPPESFTVADWAECLAEFLEVINVGPAHVVGLSWGGVLGQELYRLYPQRVRSFVFADTYAGWKGSFSESIARQRLERCRRESFLRTVTRQREDPAPLRGGLPTGSRSARRCRLGQCQTHRPVTPLHSRRFDEQTGLSRRTRWVGLLLQPR